MPENSLFRQERDTFGELAVGREHLWGAQTQRSLMHFAISTERMPPELIRALALVKGACARANMELGLLEEGKGAAIVAAAEEVAEGLHPAEFPLSLWQTGSGTQTNMNMNEVLANRASELLGGERGLGRQVHPNDEVNLGQSSNDVFPTAMHVAGCLALHSRLLPALECLIAALAGKAEAFAGIIKIGRTHLQDATPLSLGQEFSGYVAQLSYARQLILAGLPGLYALAVGATAVGTGLNAPPGFADRVVTQLARVTGLPLVGAGNKFAAIAAHDALVAVHGALKTLATALMKIANDIRWLGSGPRSGLGELHLPENEPGSSMMPGKVNPTQCEALTMVCCQVLGNDVSIAIAGASGNFELNVFKPVLAHNFLQSVRLLGDAMGSFEQHCIRGLAANEAHIAALLSRSLMLVTALVPHIGYEQAAAIARLADQEGLSLQEAALRTGFVTAGQFATWVVPERMIQPATTAGQAAQR